MNATKRKPRVGLLVGAALAAVVAVALIALGAIALSVDSDRGSAGYLSSGTTRYDAPGYALTTKSYRTGSIGGIAVPAKVLGDVHVQVRSRNAVFVGIARSADADRYLQSVRHTTVSGVDRDGIREHGRGQAMPGSPSAQSFWVASSSGRGAQDLKWHARPGHWRAVVMNADGSRDVNAGMALGAEFPHLGRDGALALTVGLLLAIGAALAARFGMGRSL